MRKTLLIALLFIPFLSISQTTKPVDGFLGIKFGSSQSDVIAALKARGGTLSNGATDIQVYFTGIKLGTRLSLGLRINFVDNKMYQGVFYFKPDHEAEVIEYYDALVNDISEVYGKGKPVAEFKSPYEKGDGHEVLALSSGHATMFTNFGEDNKNLLQIDIRSLKDQLYVIVGYYDNILLKEAKDKEKAKAKADY